MLTEQIRFHESFGTGMHVPPRRISVYLPPGYSGERPSAEASALAFTVTVRRVGVASAGAADWLQAGPWERAAAVAMQAARERGRMFFFVGG